MERVITTIQTHLSQIVKDLCDKMIGEQIEPYNSYPQTVLEENITAAIQKLIVQMEDAQSSLFVDHWKEVAPARVEQHVPVGRIIYLITSGIEAITQTIERELKDDPEAVIWGVHRVHDVAIQGIQSLSETFIAAHQELITSQASQIQALATPIIPVYSGILVLPLVGEVDTNRATRIMETLLEEIVRDQAEVVLIDITGVPMVDTTVANYLLQIGKAVELLGAQVVLVGISPEIAQTMVQLDINMSTIVTRSNLQAGIEYALKLQGQAIQPIEEE